MVKVKKDLTGQQFGMLTVLKQVEDYISPKGQHQAMWECQCSCENHTIINVVGHNLIRKKNPNCGCQNKSRYVDLTGMQFGMLTVLRRADKPKNRKNDVVYWLCECCCPEHNQIIVTTSDLNAKHTRSCGCLQKKEASKRIIEFNKNTVGHGKKNKVTKFYEENGYAYGYTSNTKQKFYIDLDDVPFAEQYTWHENDQGYIMSRIDGKLVRLHRIITNSQNDMDVDHQKHKKYDNRKSELREVTRSQNNMNRKAKGVCFDKSKNKYVAYITVNKHRKYLGYFIDEKDAIKARKLAEEKYFGEYSYDNSMALDSAVDDIECSRT